MINSQPCFQYWFGVTLTHCFKKEMLTIDMINQKRIAGRNDGCSGWV